MRTDEPKKTRVFRRKALAVVIGHCLAAGLVSGAGAATINVDAGVVADADDGQCSVVEAVFNANTDTQRFTSGGECVAGESGEDAIFLGGATFVFTQEAEVGEGNALPEITDALTIEGEGATLRRSAAAPEFRLITVGTFGRLNLRESTVTGGATSVGGGIIVGYGELTLVDSVITGNSARFLAGGIRNFRGTVNVFDSSVSGNTAGDGGGIGDFRGTINIVDGEVSNNIASEDNGLGSGGGLDLIRTELTVINGKINGNSATGQGGGILVNDAEGATVSLSRTSVSGNSSGSSGGAIGIREGGIVTVGQSTLADNTSASAGAIDNYGSLTLTNSTLSGNAATSGSGGAVYNGEGGRAEFLHATLGNNEAFGTANALFSAYSSTLLISNSIIADGKGSNGLDCFAYAGTLGTHEANLIEDGSCDPFIEGDGSPIIDALGANGGRTLTHALSLGSDAMNAGSVSMCLTEDQRGIARAPANCDIGAFEATADIVVDANGLTGVVAVADDGRCSLIEAINNTNSDSAGSVAVDECEPGVFGVADRIRLPAGATFTLTEALPAFAVDKGAVLVGNGATILRDASSPPFRIIDSSAQLTLEDLTISGGSSTVQGGGILNRTVGSLRMHNATVTGNTADCCGAGVSSYGPLDMLDSVVSNNFVTASYSGNGAISAFGSMTMRGGRIEGNSSNGFVGGVGIAGVAIFDGVSIANNVSVGEGGAIRAVESANVEIVNSTISGNTASSAGAIENLGSVTVINSTLSGNTALSGDGGALFNNEDARAEFIQSTIANNQASGSGNAIYGGYASTFLMSNSIVADGAAGNGVDCIVSGGSLGTQLNNLIEDGSCGQPSSATGDSLLAPLSDNGGPTLTHDLVYAGNPAIDGGDDDTCASVQYDQRGEPFDRIVDGDNNGTATCDIGAIEFSDSLDPVATLVSALDITSAGQTSYQFVVGFSDDSEIDSATFGIGDVSVMAPGGGLIGPINLTPMSGSSIDGFEVTYQITPPDGSWDNSDNGVYTVQMNDAEVSDIVGNFVPAGTLGTFMVAIGEPEIDITGSGMTIADGDTTPSLADDTDFGSVGLSASVTKTFTITNTGGSTLNLTGVALNSAQGTGFSITTQPGQANLSNGESTTIGVTFTASADGIATATLSVSSNDSDESPYDFLIRATGGDTPTDVIFADGFE